MKPEQYLIHGIATNNSIIINSIYIQCSEYIRSFILKNNGTIEDAKDVFQEGILIIYQVTQKRELKLTSSFSSYLYGICQRIWFNN